MSIRELKTKSHLTDRTDLASFALQVYVTMGKEIEILILNRQTRTSMTSLQLQRGVNLPFNHIKTDKLGLSCAKLMPSLAS